MLSACSSMMTDRASISSSPRSTYSAPSRSCSSRISVHSRNQLDDRRAEAGDVVADVVELVVELGAQVVHQPNRPRDVLLGSLVVGIREDLGGRVELDELAGPAIAVASTSVVKNAVRSLTRAACCMLWVTMTIVYCGLDLLHQLLDAWQWRSGRAPSTARPSGSHRARRRSHGRCTAAAAGRRTGRGPTP